MKHSVWAIAIAALLVSPRSDAGEAETKVFLNGEAVPVFFNDGDSFRVLSGSMKGAKARIAGYNTLETHGPVHSWGSWTTKEMYVLAKMATLHARRGVWHCESDGETDTYGRMLTFCPGLGEELVRLGLAHAMSVTDEPADAKLLAAQREAMEAERGIWAHGKPAFVLTSLHSVEEDLKGTGTYNRLVSSEDGHSVKWKHTTRYEECQNVCQQVYSVDDSAVQRVAAGLAKDSAIAPHVADLSGEQRVELVREYARFRHVGRAVEPDAREAVKARLDALAADGAFPGEPESGSCMVHVPFERRYGGTRAKCLK